MYPNDMSAKVGSTVPVISAELQRLEKSQMELSEVVSALEGRLSVAMREPEMSQIRTENPGIAPAQSQLAVMIRQRASEAEGLVYRLSSMLRRLDI